MIEVLLEGVTHDKPVIATVITAGREGAAKKYKQFAMGMPKQKLSDDDVTAVVAHIKGQAK